MAREPIRSTSQLEHSMKFCFFLLTFLIDWTEISKAYFGCFVEKSSFVQHPQF